MVCNYVYFEILRATNVYPARQCQQISYSDYKRLPKFLTNEKEENSLPDLKIV
jgi:hypothetical protein